MSCIGKAAHQVQVDFVDVTWPGHLCPVEEMSLFELRCSIRPVHQVFVLRQPRLDDLEF